MAVIAELVSNWRLIFAVVPGLILFLYGIEHFSAEIQRVAGERFRSVLGRLTSNRYKGAFLGALLTAVIQSSTATTVIVVGLVNAGTISFMQSLGVLFGANVGTTVTAQLVALKLTSFAPVFIVIGFLMGFVGGRYKFMAKPIFYFGLVFFSLNLISDAMIPIKSDPEISSLFTSFSSVWVALVAGFLFTVLVQSSSVTSGIVVLLTGSGLINLAQGVPLLIGSNLGTTTTAILASSGMSLHARRAAAAHFLFNLFGIILMMPFLNHFILFVEGLGGPPAQQVANAHMIFNFIFAILFLLVLKQFKDLIEKVVPGKEEEILFKTRYLNNKIPEDSGEFFSLVVKELHHSLDVSGMLFDESFKMLNGKGRVNISRASKLEALNDFLDERIEAAILSFSRRELNVAEAKKTMLLVRISNAIEQLADLGDDISVSIKNVSESGSKMSPQAMDGYVEVYTKFRENMSLLHSFDAISKEVVQKIKSNDDVLRELINRNYAAHLSRIQKTNSDSTFIELLSLLEAANAKVREIRKLSEMYAKLKT